LPNQLIQEHVEVPVFVIDWEMAQLGVPNQDLGQMIAELYELKLYKDIEAGMWLVEGFVNGYGKVSEDFAFRTAIAVGTHLLAFGTSVEGWGTPDQVQEVARTGRDLIVKSWSKDRSWFETGELRLLFSRCVAHDGKDRKTI
jgi:hypothetical protein